jgi:hypothetical protein
MKRLAAWPPTASYLITQPMRRQVERSLRKQAETSNLNFAAIVLVNFYTEHFLNPLQIIKSIVCF